MREILFRGKRIDNGEWVSSGNLITFTDEGEGRQFFIPQMNAKCTCTHDEQDNIVSFNSGMFCKVNPDTVGQFTGLTDKNGKRIFEGDIVRDGYLFGKVVFASAQDGFDGMAGFMVDDINDGLQNYNGFWHEVEVIGNIHDDKSLLNNQEAGE